MPPLQLCLEGIDEAFGEEAAVASEKLLLRVRAERLAEQRRHDEVFVAATVVQNLYVDFFIHSPANAGIRARLQAGQW